MDKTNNNNEHKFMRKCSMCEYRKWYGDYAIYICVKTGKVIEPYYYCDIEVKK